MVYLPLCKVADTPFHIQGDELYSSSFIRNVVNVIDARWVSWVVGKSFGRRTYGFNQQEYCKCSVANLTKMTKLNPQQYLLSTNAAVQSQNLLTLQVSRADPAFWLQPEQQIHYKWYIPRGCDIQPINVTLSKINSGGHSKNIISPLYHVYRWRHNYFTSTVSWSKHKVISLGRINYGNRHIMNVGIE